MKFCRNFTNIFRKCQISGELQKILKKLRKFGQNPETDEIIQSFFLIYSVVSLAADDAELGCGLGLDLRVQLLRVEPRARALACVPRRAH